MSKLNLHKGLKGCPMMENKVILEILLQVQSKNICTGGSVIICIYLHIRIYFYMSQIKINLTDLIQSICFNVGISLKG